MNKFPSTMRLIPTVAALTIGLFASGAVAQNYLQGEPGEAPGVSTTGGKPVPVDPAELRRDNTANQGSLPSARR